MTLLIILDDRNNAVVWIGSNHSLISKFSSLCTNPLVTVPRETIITGITVTFMFHIFQFPRKVRELTFFPFFQFYSMVSQISKVHNSARSHFFYCLFVWPRLGDLLVFQNLRSVCASHSLGQILGCVYSIFRIVKLQILLNSQWTNLLSKPCLVLYSVLICCIRLFYDWCFRLHHHITYICCFVASYPFLLWYDLSLLRRIVRLREEILFLS